MHVVPDAGHLLLMDHADECADLITVFPRSDESAPSRDTRPPTGASDLGILWRRSRLRETAWHPARCRCSARSVPSVRVSSGALSMVPDDVAVSERLENLQSLTDSTLAHLDVDDLLVELLARVRVILDVDTAAVLILDERAQELVARAACGIEDEVRQGVRIPLGVGFAGRIAATKEPRAVGSCRLDNGRRIQSCGNEASRRCSVSRC